MSQIKATEITGDVAVSRHVAAGGNATIQGNALVKKGLRVEGWLDAPNIKGPTKGVFRTEETLKSTYPHPFNGWWALVGDTLPAALYVAFDGKWVATGKTAGDINVDMQTFNEQLELLNADMEAAQNDISDIRGSIGEINTEIEETQGNVNKVANDLSTLKTTVSGNTRAIQAIADSKGASNGIATLDNKGHVPASQLTGAIEIFEVKDIEEVNTEKTSKTSSTYGCRVVYDRTRKRLLLSSALTLGHDTVGSGTEGSTETIPGGGITPPSIDNDIYYTDWADADTYGTASDTGRIPLFGKAYACKSEGLLYCWNGKELSLVGDDPHLELGETEQTAYPGAKGKQLKRDFDSLSLDYASAVHIIDGHAYINANALLGEHAPITLADFTNWADDNATISRLITYGCIVRLLSADGWKDMRYIGDDPTSDMQDTASWQDAADDHHWVDEADKGVAGGVATLDQITGCVSSRQLLGALEIGGIVGGVEVSSQPTDKMPTDANCSVVYDTTRGCLLLRDKSTGISVGPGMTSGGAISQPTSQAGGGYTYYSDWRAASIYGEASANGYVPYFGKAYLCTSDLKVYSWDGSVLSPVGQSVKQLRGDLDDLTRDYNSALYSIDGHAHINANALMESRDPITFVDFTNWADDHATLSRLITFGCVVRFLSAAGWKDMRYIGEDPTSDLQDTSCWEDATNEGGDYVGKSEKGALGGVATLDEFTGFVPAQQLLGALAIGGFSEDAELSSQTSDKMATDTDCCIVYDTKHKRLLLRETRRSVAVSPLAPGEVSEQPTTPAGGGSNANTYVYYADWRAAILYGEASERGRIPECGKAYACTSDRKIYIWNGETMSPIGSGYGSWRPEMLSDEDAWQLVESAFGQMQERPWPSDSLTNEEASQIVDDAFEKN